MGTVFRIIPVKVRTVFFPLEHIRIITPRSTITTLIHTERLNSSIICPPTERSHNYFPITFYKITGNVIILWITGIFDPVIIAILLIQTQEFPSRFQCILPAALLIIPVPGQMLRGSFTLIVGFGMIEQGTGCK